MTADDWAEDILRFWFDEVGAAELLVGAGELLDVLVEVALVLSAMGVGWAALVGVQAASATTPPVSSTANLSFTLDLPPRAFTTGDREPLANCVVGRCGMCTKLVRRSSYGAVERSAHCTCRREESSGSRCAATSSSGSAGMLHPCEQVDHSFITEPYDSLMCEISDR